MFPSAQRLRDWRNPSKITPSHLQEPVDALRQIYLANGYDSDVRHPRDDVWFGKIVSTGPNGESLSDVGAKGEQYWVQRQFIIGGQLNDPVRLADATDDGSFDTLSGFDDDDNPIDLDPIFLCTNLIELPHHCRSCPLGTFVKVWGEWDWGLTSDVASGGSSSEGTPEDNQKRYVFRSYNRPVFKIAGTVTKFGMYTANPMGPPTTKVDPTSASALAETDFGVADMSVTVYLINVLEKGASSGHTQSTGAIIPGDFRTFATDGKPVFEIEAC